MINLGEIIKNILPDSLHLGTFFWIVVAVAIVLCGMVYLFLERAVEEDDGYKYDKKLSIMTQAELSFFKVLESAVGEYYYIFPQIHLDMLLEHKVKGQSFKGARSHISQKSVDFVLCDPQTLQVVLAIELDDFSHTRKDRIIRDKEVERILKTAYILLCRFIVTKTFDPNEIRKVTYSAIDTSNAK